MRSIILFSSCFLIVQSAAAQHALEEILKTHAARFDAILHHPEEYQVQIVYTQIDRDAQNRPHFQTFRYGVDPQLYYYPASTVKMPAAFLAMEKLNKLAVKGLDKDAVMKTGAASAPQTAVEADTTAAGGLPSVGHYVKKIFVVSDNDAYNRLYEFLGQQYFNEQLHAKGFNDTRIIHRLSVSGFDPEANRHTNPVSFYKNGQLLYHQGEVYSNGFSELTLRKQQQGKGWLNDNTGQVVPEPFDFSYKNYVSLDNLHDMLQAIMFPQDVPKQQRFDLTEADYRFLYQCMSVLPAESKHPRYDDYEHYPDGYGKFFLYGDTTARIPSNIRIFNKVGYAYGFLTDVAYIVDFEKGVEFLLAANIRVNANGIFNDGKYETESIGIPFLAHLGRAVYEYETKRIRTYRPDLSRFMVGPYR